jgi:CrcB protein
MLRDFIWVGLGGAAGSMARYAVTLAVNKVWDKPLPLATLSINLTGSLLIGLLWGLTARYQWGTSGTAWLLLATGLCGGFTTFSAFALENVKLLQGNLAWTSLLYLLCSIAGGILLCRAGYLLAR